MRKLNGLRRRQQSSLYGRMRDASIVLLLELCHLPRDFLLRRLRVEVTLFVEAIVTARFPHTLKVIIAPRLVWRQSNIILVAKQSRIEVEGECGLDRALRIKVARAIVGAKESIRVVQERIGFFESALLTLLCEQVVGRFDDLVVRHAVRVSSTHEEAFLCELLLVLQVPARLSLTVLLFSYLSDEAIDGCLMVAPSVGDLWQEVSLQVLRNRQIKLVQFTNPNTIASALH